MPNSSLLTVVVVNNLSTFIDLHASFLNQWKTSSLDWWTEQHWDTIENIARIWYAFQNVSLLSGYAIFELLMYLSSIMYTGHSGVKFVHTSKFLPYKKTFKAIL